MSKQMKRCNRVLLNDPNSPLGGRKSSKTSVEEGEKAPEKKAEDEVRIVEDVDCLFEDEKLSFNPEKEFVPLGIIGRGATGWVFAVKRKSTNEILAMKVMRISKMLKRLQRVLVEREILTLARSHPFITSLFFAYRTTTHLHFVMEMCHCGDLSCVLKRCGGRLPEAAVKFYAAELVVALEYLHTLGFLYRDLKPANVLICESGHIRLADFGIAKQGVISQAVFAPLQKCKSKLERRVSLGLPTPTAALNPAVRATRRFSFRHKTCQTSCLLSRSNSFVGTLQYMCPEVVEGDKEQSWAVDWWSLGCLLFECLYGHPPFESSDGTQEDLFVKILKAKLIFPREPKVSKQFKSLLRGLLNRSPEERLGRKGGSVAIKNHALFKDVKWALIRQQAPPLIPPCVELSPLPLCCNAGSLGSSFSRCFQAGECLCHSQTDMRKKFRSSKCDDDDSCSTDEWGSKHWSFSKGGSVEDPVELEKGSDILERFDWSYCHPKDGTRTPPLHPQRIKTKRSASFRW